MKFPRTAVSLLLLAALGTTAQAQSEKTSEQVQAKSGDATQSCVASANHDAALKRNEGLIQHDPKEPQPTMKQAARLPSRIGPDPMLDRKSVV